VNHWSASSLPTSRTTDDAQRERKRQLEMLQQYEEVITAAGWCTKLTTSLMNLTVYAKAEG